MIKLVREADMSPCITDRLTVKCNPTHFLQHISTYFCYFFIFPHLFVNLSGLDLCHVLLACLHSHSPQQTQRNVKSRLPNDIFPCLNSPTLLFNSQLSLRVSMPAAHKHTPQRETLSYLSHVIWSAKTVLRYLFWITVTHRWSPCCSSDVSHWHACVCKYFCEVRTLGDLLQNVSFLNPPYACG